MHWDLNVRVFFRIEFDGIFLIFRICKKLFLVILKMKITRNGVLQIEIL